MQNDNINSVYNVFGEALWALFTQNKKSIQADYYDDFLAVTHALADASDRGSICFVADADLSNAGEHLQEIGLAMPVIQAKQITHPVLDKLAPIVLDQDQSCTRLYWQRNFSEEWRLAKQIAVLTKRPVDELTQPQTAFLKRCQLDHFADHETFVKRQALLKTVEETNDTKVFAQALTELWPAVKSSLDQTDAIKRLATHAFGIITGGPGTGKTTTVARLLECLLKANPAMTIALAAPTGKATARMQDSIRLSLQNDPTLYPLLKTAFDQGQVEAHTLHKWLVTPTSSGQAPNAGNPIEFDAFVVDEASMIDSGLALRFFESINRQKARVYLLGDKYQLAAVGPGSIFAELTDHHSPVSDFVGQLNISHRFTDDSNVGALARAINAGNYDSVQRVLNGETLSGLDFGLEPFKRLGEIKEWLQLNTTADCEPKVSSKEQSNHTGAKDRVEWVKTPKLEEVKKWMTPHLDRIIAAVRALESANGDTQTQELKHLWDATESFRVLAANRQGTLSVNGVNEWADQYMRECLGAGVEEEFYSGKMLIVRINNDELNVFNGDVGIVVPIKEETNTLRVIFDAQGKRSLPTGLLPKYDLAYAMTIHQSQGSDYESVAVLLPQEDDSPLATRELLYTGVTRAKKAVTVFAKPAILKRACEECTVRESGLNARLSEEINDSPSS